MNNIEEIVVGLDYLNYIYEVDEGDLKACLDFMKDRLGVKNYPSIIISDKQKMKVFLEKALEQLENDEIYLEPEV
jgi:hypothetical protein